MGKRYRGILRSRKPKCTAVPRGQKTLNDYGKALQKELKGETITPAMFARARPSGRSRAAASRRRTKTIEPVGDPDPQARTRFRARGAPRGPHRAQDCWAPGPLFSRPLPAGHGKRAPVVLTAATFHLIQGGLA